ncbi:hypothetical protein H5410_045448 [Solanum commersonii]|uniref:Uncharacterized protein n=1 Tax=Solanum commersonii TaxID=4109 RepID=A0A9J5XCQ6_SOLCO|nr:hypothetical protein H5410_045448 [Solanum commersonii]
MVLYAIVTINPQGILTHNVDLLIGRSYTAFQRRKMLMMKNKFFQENGGLVLLQRLKGEEGSSNTNTVKIFAAEELEKATNDFDKELLVKEIMEICTKDI